MLIPIGNNSRFLVLARLFFVFISTKRTSLMFAELRPMNQLDNFTLADVDGNNSITICENLDQTSFFWYWFYADLICSSISIVGNFLVIYVVAKNPKLKTALNFLLVNMSVSDIAYPLLSLSGVAFLYLTLGGGLNESSGWFLCNFVSFFLNVSAAVSIESLVVIAFHRCFAVMYPLRTKTDEKRKIFPTIAVIWIVGISVFAPHLFYTSAKNEDGILICNFTMEERAWEIYDFVISVSLRIIPFLTLCTLYPLIIITIKRQRIPGNTTSTQAKRKKQNIQLTKMCLSIVFLFFCFWGVHEALYLTSLYIPIDYYCRVLLARFIVFPFPSISAAVNPIVYFAYCRNFRHELKTLFGKRQHRHFSTRSETTRGTIELH